MSRIHDFLMHSVAGVPLWFPILILLGACASQAIKVAGWTSAERLVEFAARVVLKIPAVGVFIAAIPLLGDVLHFIANDPERLPPTTRQRIQRARAARLEVPKPPPLPPAQP